tara:strand:- start:120 stop:383 length:264 start_codon:yes stop_codon:yes gene_type:complete
MNELRCHKIIHPFKKGAEDYACKRLHFKDGWCKQHHPELIAKKAEEAQIQNLKSDKILNKENAILLLIQLGYEVSKGICLKNNLHDK